MITIEKLLIFKEFKGDVDSWSRQSSINSEYYFESKDWTLIDNLIQDVIIVNNGLASKVFTDKLENDLLKNCDCNETMILLKNLAAAI